MAMPQMPKWYDDDGQIVSGVSIFGDCARSSDGP